MVSQAIMAMTRISQIIFFKIVLALTILAMAVKLVSLIKLSVLSFNVVILSSSIFLLTISLKQGFLLANASSGTESVSFTSGGGKSFVTPFLTNLGFLLGSMSNDCLRSSASTEGKNFPHLMM